MSDPYVVDADAVERAAARLDGVARRTPLERNDRLSALTGADVRLKREDLQSVRSYKLRGAYSFMAELDDARRAAGVVAASAGNHAQGVAFACQALGVQGRIYVPRTTPRQKRDRIAAVGGPSVTVLVQGDTYDECVVLAAKDAQDRGSTLVP